MPELPSMSMPDMFLVERRSIFGPATELRPDLVGFELGDLLKIPPMERGGFTDEEASECSGVPERSLRTLQSVKAIRSFHVKNHGRLTRMWPIISVMKAAWAHAINDAIGVDYKISGGIISQLTLAVGEEYLDMDSAAQYDKEFLAYYAYCCGIADDILPDPRSRKFSLARDEGDFMIDIYSKHDAKYIYVCIPHEIEKEIAHVESNDDFGPITRNGTIFLGGVMPKMFIGSRLMRSPYVIRIIDEEAHSEPHFKSTFQQWRIVEDEVREITTRIPSVTRINIGLLCRICVQRSYGHSDDDIIGAQIDRLKQRYKENNLE